eukprot:gene6108-2710_t
MQSMRISSRSSAFVASSVAPVRRVACAPAKALTVEVEAKIKAKTRKAGKQHFNEKMSRSQVVAKSKMIQVSDSDMLKMIKCLPNSGLKRSSK